MSKPFQPDEIIRAVGIKLHEQSGAFNERIEGVERDYARDLARLREEIDEYGNLIRQPGPAGRDGRDGLPGVQGPQGERGERGQQGEVGAQGLQGERGEAGPQGEAGYCGEARGLWKADGIYRKKDVVALNGSEWRAVRDDPGPLPGDGWMLGAKGVRGPQGERGERGERGPEGLAGRDGVGIAGLTRRDWRIVLVLTDGSEITADLRGMFEDFHREAF